MYPKIIIVLIFFLITLPAVRSSSRSIPLPGIKSYFCSDYTNMVRAPYSGVSNCKGFCDTFSPYLHQSVYATVYQPRHLLSGPKVCSCKQKVYTATCSINFVGAKDLSVNERFDPLDLETCKAYCDGKDPLNLVLQRTTASSSLYGGPPLVSCSWMTTTTVQSKEIVTEIMPYLLNLDGDPSLNFPNQHHCPYSKGSCIDHQLMITYTWPVDIPYQELCSLHKVGDYECTFYFNLRDGQDTKFLDCPGLPGMLHPQSIITPIPKNCQISSPLFSTTEHLVTSFSLPQNITKKLNFSTTTTLESSKELSSFLPALEETLFMLQEDINNQSGRLCLKLCDLENRLMALERLSKHEFFYTRNNTQYKVYINQGLASIRPCLLVDQISVQLPLRVTCNGSTLLVDAIPYGRLAYNPLTFEVKPICKDNNATKAINIQLDNQWYSLSSDGNLRPLKDISSYFSSAPLAHDFLLQQLDLENEQKTLLSHLQEITEKRDVPVEGKSHSYIISAESHVRSGWEKTKLFFSEHALKFYICIGVLGLILFLWIISKVRSFFKTEPTIRHSISLDRPQELETLIANALKTRELNKEHLN